MSNAIPHAAQDGPSAGAVAPGRNCLVDFVRGIALLVMYLDHNIFSVLRFATPKYFQCVDATEVFVFISGYVCGMVYSRVLFARGFAACQKKAARRMWQIYLAQSSLLIVCLALVNSFAAKGILLERPSLYVLHQAPAQTILGIITLTYVPDLIGLLPLYLLFIGFMPLALHLRIRAPRLLVALAVAAYLFAQIFPAFQLHSYPTGNLWFFNPLGWQLLYLIGLWLGHAEIASPGFGWRPSRNLRILAWCAVAGFVVLRIAPSPQMASVLHTDVLTRTLFPLPFGSKETMGPLRLINFAALLIALDGLRPSSSFLKSRWAQPFIVCGQNSLAVYWVGLVLSYLAIFGVAAFHLGQLPAAIVDLTGCAILLGWAYFWEAVRWYFRNSLPPRPLTVTVQP